MKYKLFGLFFVVLFAFVFIPITNGATQDNGGGIYYDLVTGRYCENSSGCSMDNPTDIDAARAERQRQLDLQLEVKYVVAGVPTGGQIPTDLPPNSCLTNTQRPLADGSGQCEVYINGSIRTISYCPQWTTTGQCSPERLNAAAAAAAARRESIRTGKSCVASLLTFPGVDQNTSLGGYYSTDCSGSSDGGGSNGSTGGSTGTRTNYFGGGSTVGGTNYFGAGSTLSGAGSYANNLLSIARSIISNLNAIIQSTPGQNMGTTGATSSVVSSMSSVSNSRLQQIISQANVLPYSSLTPSEQTALTDYLAVNRTALVNQNFQAFAPGSVFAWSLSMGTFTTLNSQAQSLGFTTLNPLTFMFVKTPGYVIPTATSTNAVFTSNTSGTMYMGSSWNITITGLNPNETIYATGGKKVGGVVPTDRTPYTANNLGIFIRNDVHATNTVGDWQLVWTRADGTNLTTLTFSVLSAPATATTANICCSFTGWYECGGSIPYNPFPTLTPYYINGVSTLGTRQCGVQPATVTTAPVGTQPVITTPVSTSTSMITFPATITVTAELLRIRTEPNTQSRQINSFQRRATFTAGNIVPGESIEGNNQWFSFIYGTMPAYVWSGGTAQSLVGSTVINFPVTVTVISTLPLNVRSAPRTDAVAATQFKEGDTFSAGNVVEGESVEGNNKWWVFIYGTMPAYVWSGGAAVIH